MTAAIEIDGLTTVPLFLECRCDGGTETAKATGFVISHEGELFLLSNWHVFTGRHYETGEPISSTGLVDPDWIRVWFHVKGLFGQWKAHERRLRSPDGDPLWIEHRLGRRVDVAAMRLLPPDDVQVYPLDLQLADTDLKVSPSEPVAIVGFPLGLAVVGRVPIWKTGHVGSDIDLDYRDEPMFLVDARTLPAMSGSPVVARRIGWHRLRSGAPQLAVEVNRFMGVYGGRVSEDSEIGMVWKPRVVREILEAVKGQPSSVAS
jgi:hypothetical protein